MATRKKAIAAVLCLVSTLAMSKGAQATLIDQGRGLIYDDALDITWLQDANIAATNSFGVSGIDANGYMNWFTAQALVAAMNTENYLGFNDWRLPETTGTLNRFGLFAPTDCRYVSEELCKGNELGYMYYYNLSGSQGDDLTGSQAIFTDIGSVYWIGTENPNSPDSAFGLIFGAGGGGCTSCTQSPPSQITLGQYVTAPPSRNHPHSHYWPLGAPFSGTDCCGAKPVRPPYIWLKRSAASSFGRPRPDL